MGRARKHTADALDVPKLLPVSVAILDRSGTIVGVNEGWRISVGGPTCELPTLALEQTI